jgi:hypothetical protein
MKIIENHGAHVEFKGNPCEDLRMKSLCIEYNFNPVLARIKSFVSTILKLTYQLGTKKKKKITC